jgi:hypothetical protein
MCPTLTVPDETTLTRTQTNQPTPPISEEPVYLCCHQPIRVRSNSQYARPEMRPIALFTAGRDRCKTLSNNLEEGRRNPISFTRTATVGVHERERSHLLSGPPGSRSQRLRIKRNLPSVVLCRSRCACPLFSRNRVVLSRSRRVVLQKYEA